MLYVSGVYLVGFVILHAHFDLVVCFGYIACLGVWLVVCWLGLVLLWFLLPLFVVALILWCDCCCDLCLLLW